MLAYNKHLLINMHGMTIKLLEVFIRQNRLGNLHQSCLHLAINQDRPKFSFEESVSIMNYNIEY
jgi:hypothetical protein